MNAQKRRKSVKRQPIGANFRCGLKLLNSVERYKFWYLYLFYTGARIQNFLRLSSSLIERRSGEFPRVSTFVVREYSRSCAINWAGWPSSSRSRWLLRVTRRGSGFNFIAARIDFIARRYFVFYDRRRPSRVLLVRNSRPSRRGRGRGGSQKLGEPATSPGLVNSNVFR